MKEKLDFWTVAIIVSALIGAFLGGQFTGYLNRIVAEGISVEEIRSHPVQYMSDWIADTHGNWVW